jgi:hypothetical protein
MRRLAATLAAFLVAAPLAAQDQVVPPTGTAESAQNSCTTSTAHGTCDEGVPGGGDWCTASTCAASPTNSTSWRFSFDTPSSPPSFGADAQTLAAYVRSCAANGTNPTCRLDLYCAGALVETGAEQAVSTAATITETVTLTGACASDGSDVEARVVCTASGGTPSGRRTGELDAVEWRVTFAPVSTRSRGHVVGSR